MFHVLEQIRQHFKYFCYLIVEMEKKFSKILQVSNTNMILFNWLYAEEELGQVIKHPTREGIMILTPCIFQIIIAFVVEHFIGGKIHCSIKELIKKETVKII